MTKIINCKIIADKKIKKLKSSFSKLTFTPTIAIISSKQNKESERYIQKKIELANRLKIKTVLVYYNRHTEVPNLINKFNKNKSVYGIILQLPIYNCKNLQLVHNYISLIEPAKDIDGFTPINRYKITHGITSGIPGATSLAILDALSSINRPTNKDTISIIGHGDTAGSHITNIFLSQKRSISILDINNQNSLPTPHDIVISCVGKGNLITKNYINKNGVFIDVGFSFKKGKLCGDGDIESLENHVAYRTKVPGGIGLLTVVNLFQNLHTLIKLNEKNKKKIR